MEEGVSYYRDMLAKAGCILEGQFFFALKKAGLVTLKYIDIDPVFTDPAAVWSLGRALIQPFAGRFNCIVGPAIGGIPLVYASAFAAISGLDMTQEVHIVTTAFAEKKGDGFSFDRMAFAKAVKGRNVLVVEDISSTGDTTKAVCDLAKEAGGNLVGASLVWNRGDITADMINVPELHALVTERVQTYNVSEDPPGWGQLPLVSDIGHPDYYPNYKGPRITLLAV